MTSARKAAPRPSSGASRAARRSKTSRANPRNPRRTFTETELNELAASIKERGIIQPIVVRAVRGEDDQFEIIAGERRWRAAQRAGLHEVPIAVVEATDAQALEFAIIENVQRADLNPMEEAAGYRALMEEFNHSQDDVGADRRQEPAACGEHAAAAEAARAGASTGAMPANCRPATRACWSASRTPSRSRDDVIKKGWNVRQLEADMRKDGARQAARSRRHARAPRTPTPRRWRRDCPMRSGSRWRSISAPTAAARCISSIAIWISSMRC